jgi:hypothetical protein
LYIDLALFTTPNYSHPNWRLFNEELVGFRDFDLFPVDRIVDLVTNVFFLLGQIKFICTDCFLVLGSISWASLNVLLIQYHLPTLKWNG